MQPERFEELFPYPLSSSMNYCFRRRLCLCNSHSTPEQSLLHASYSHSRLFERVELTFRLFPIDSFDVANSRIGLSKLAHLLVTGDSKNFVRSRKCVSLVEIFKARRVVCPNLPKSYPNHSTFSHFQQTLRC